MIDTYLDQIKPGTEVTILEIPEKLKVDLLRLGLSSGSKIECLSKIPAGPVVLCCDLQEIAIGNNYAKKIKVKKC